MASHTGQLGYLFNIRGGENDPSDDHNLDWKVVDESWKQNVYRLTPELFYKNGQNIFIDIGANIGAVTLKVDSFNHDFGEGKFITTYAFEPEPNNLQLLLKNIEENPTSPNIQVFPSAITGDGRSFNISDRGGNAREDRTGTKVKSQTLSNFMDFYNIEEVDALKIDVEGAEYEIIMSIPDDYLQRIKYIALELDRRTPEEYGAIVYKLARSFKIETLGSPDDNGVYIYAWRY